MEKINNYNLKVKKILSCKNLTKDEKQLLIDDIKLPINHTTGYYKGDDDPNDINLLTKEERELYGIH